MTFIEKNKATKPLTESRTPLTFDEMKTALKNLMKENRTLYVTTWSDKLGSTQSLLPPEVRHRFREDNDNFSINPGGHVNVWFRREAGSTFFFNGDGIGARAGGSGDFLMVNWDGNYEPVY